MDVQFSGEIPPIEVYKNEEMKKFVIKFLEEVADIKIKGYIVADIHINDCIVANNIIIQHEVNNVVYNSDIETTSSGFKFLFALAPAIKKAIENGDRVKINGAEGILHPLVMEKLRNIS